jgi:hypothetical protein
MPLLSKQIGGCSVRQQDSSKLGFARELWVPRRSRPTQSTRSGYAAQFGITRVRKTDSPLYRGVKCCVACGSAATKINCGNHERRYRL